MSPVLRQRQRTFRRKHLQNLGKEGGELGVETILFVA